MFKGLLAPILDIFRNGKRFFLCTHVHPDADGLGSMLALALALEEQGKEVWCYIDGERPLFTKWLPGGQKLLSSLPGDRSWIGVVLDCSEAARVGQAKDFVCGLDPLVVLDHHEVTGALGTHQVIVPIYATGGLIYYLLKALGWSITIPVAENLYAAIFSDTGGFRYSQTTLDTFQVACDLVARGVDPHKIAEILYEHYPLSRFCLLGQVLSRLIFWAQGKVVLSYISHEDFLRCQAQKTDPADFSSMLRCIDGVEVSVLLKEYHPGEFSVSLRSRGQINVALLAQEWGGGGHSCAAGFRINGSLTSILKLLKRRLEDLFK